MRILIAEDETKTREYLQKGLTEAGFTVDAVADGLEALYCVQETQYDIMLLDVMLPQMAGWELIQKIRQHDNHTPVLFLTAKDTVDDRVKGLELGADDYLVKPFAFSELLARIKSLLRRGQTQQVKSLSIADLEIDLFKQKAYRGGKLLHLSAKEFALLALFMQHQGDVLSRTLIAEKIWDINFDPNTNVIDVAVRRLRQKIDATSPKLIHTLRGRGYVMEIRKSVV